MADGAPTPMARLAVLVLTTAVLAGCNAPAPPALEVAQAAAARLAADHGPKGELQRMDTTLDVTAASGKSHTRARSTWEAHEPDGISIALWYDLFDVGGGRNASVEDVRLRLVCLPDRVVLTTTGMAALERNDTDSQTPNDVGGCLGHENGNLSASLLRLIPQLEAPFWNTLVRSAFTPDAPNRSATSASYDGDRIRANYEVTVGTTTVPLDSVVVGGRIVSDHLVGSGRGLSYESSVSYTYGPRPQPPADVGTHLV